MVTGGSYGGHMTFAIATLYADRIRAFLPIVGMSNLVTFLERTESYRRDLRRVEYGDERDPQTLPQARELAPELRRFYDDARLARAQLASPHEPASLAPSERGCVRPGRRRACSYGCEWECPLTEEVRPPLRLTPRIRSPIH